MSTAQLSIFDIPAFTPTMQDYLSVRFTGPSNYRICAAIGTGTPLQRMRENIKAIETLQALDGGGRVTGPTGEEKANLARYVGWGALQDIFRAWSGEAAELNDKLKKLLSPEQYAAAQHSTLNAHYTSAEVVGGLWRIAERLGVGAIEGPRILEPALGIGNIIGLMPKYIEESAEITGIELDATTAAMARHLYQKAKIVSWGFESVKMADGYFDLAISNVPFGDYKVSDRLNKDLNRQNFSIHDYFFAKAIDKVRDGGLVIFITSRYTMDKQNPKLRLYLDRKASFIGAIRLPNTAFKECAGTEVTADIVILQKGVSPMRQAWERSTTPAGFTVAFNEYFQKNPHMVLGNMAQDGRLYGGVKELTVNPGKAPLVKALEGAINHLPANIMGATSNPVTVTAVKDGDKLLHGLVYGGYPGVKKGVYIDDGIIEGSYHVKEGALYRRELYHDRSIEGRHVEAITALVGIKDAARRLLADQLAGEDATGSRERLNGLYDRFLSEFGTIRENSRVFGDDPEYPFVSALEQYNEKDQQIGKAAIFHENVIIPVKNITRAESAKDALVASLSQKGRLDMGYMAAITGKAEGVIAEELRGLIFKEPASGAYQTGEEYLSGDVKTKLEAAKDAGPEFRANVEALEKVVPVDISIGDIRFKIGNSWIKPSIYEQFVKDVFKGGEVSLMFVPTVGAWVMETLGWYDKNTAENTAIYGTEAYPAVNVFFMLLNGKALVVKTEDAEGRAVVDHDQTNLLNERGQAMKDAFVEWVHNHPAIGATIESLYNEKLNRTAKRKFDGAHLDLQGSNPAIKFRPHQINAVWRIMASDKNIYAAHPVGTGKSFVMAAGAMELKRIGRTTKSIIATIKSQVHNIATQFRLLYPAARLLVPGKDDFKRENRQRFLATIATGNYDAVIMSHNQFKALPVRRETEEGFLMQQIGVMEDAMSSLSGAEGKATRRSVKMVEKAKAKLEAKLKNLLDAERDENIINFEDLGADQLFIDEAQIFKNLMFQTNLGQSVAGIGQTGGNQRSADLLMKSRWLERYYGTGRLVFASGTPITNSIAELYTIQRYLQNDVLVELGQTAFDAWARDWAETQLVMERKPEGNGYQKKVRFAKFQNLPELMTIAGEVLDVVNEADLHIPGVPKVAGGKATVCVVEPTRAVKEIMASFVPRADDIRSHKVEPYEDNMLKVCTDGRKAALDVRLYDPGLPDEPGSKLNQAVRNIHRVWKETNGQGLTQLVFCDMGTPKRAAA